VAALREIAAQKVGLEMLRKSKLVSSEDPGSGWGSH